MTSEEAFGVQIRQLREASGLSLRKAALKIEITHLRLAELEKGRNRATDRPTRPRPELVARIASAYGVPLDGLLELAGYAREHPDLSPEEQLVVDLLRRLDQHHRELAVQLVKTLERSWQPKS